jgi:hypothetical protein
MNFLTPHDAASIFLLVTVLTTEFLLGYCLVKIKKAALATWAFPVVSVLIIHFFLLNEPAGFRMIALILVLLIGMKVVTASHYPTLLFTLGKWFLYCFTWVGMNPEIFFKHRLKADQSLMHRGLFFFVSGASLLLLLRFGLTSDSIPEGFRYYILSLVLLIALSQVLHFGLLNISAWCLQILKYPAYSLFRDPLRAESLRDFWGKRWNLAFTEMTSVAVYRPLSKRWTTTQAFLASFLFSGLLHEVALSLPVKTGYGLPLVYFAIQLILILIEEKIFKRRPGKVWVILGLILPLPILFHPAIMKAVFWQFIL